MKSVSSSSTKTLSTDTRRINMATLPRSSAATATECSKMKPVTRITFGIVITFIRAILWNRLTLLMINVVVYEKQVFIFEIIVGFCQQLSPSKKIQCEHCEKYFHKDSLNRHIYTDHLRHGSANSAKKYSRIMNH